MLVCVLRFFAAPCQHCYCGQNVGSHVFSYSDQQICAGHDLVEARVHCSYLDHIWILVVSYSEEGGGERSADTHSQRTGKRIFGAY
jgi:hypothetical protein